MKRQLIVLFVCLFGLLNAGCYNTYNISKEELGKLQSGQEQSSVQVTSSAGEPVEISAETPLEVEISSGSFYRITPFNFLLSDQQLVSPDYDLLLSADAVQGAQVREISYGKTFGLVGGVVGAVVTTFVVLAVLN